MRDSNRWGTLVWGFLTGLSFLFVASCSSSESKFALPQRKAMKFTSDWNRQWWLEKTSRALRGGDPVSDSEDRSALGNHPDQTVDRFLADSRFSDTVLDFSLMFIGFRQDRIKAENEVYLAPVYLYPQAILASKETSHEGDFFKIFNWSQRIYLSPLPRPSAPEFEMDSLTDSELREKLFSAIQLDLDQLAILARGGASTDTVCAAFKIHEARFIDQDPLRITAQIPYQVFYLDEYYGGPNQFCDARSGPSYDFSNSFSRIKEKNEKLFSVLRGLDASVYRPKNVDEIKEFESEEIVPSYHYNAFKAQSLSRFLQNSSTNFNRKRSSYILKRFLCDDLTPINVENPSVHAGDVHGTTPSCFACHYKLDPVAGFFRYYRGAFEDFSNRSTISFDDNASMPISEYLKSWNTVSPGQPPLNVGYIRSTQNTDSNFYGSSLEDLFSFLKTAPEARRCLMKRAYEYLVSSDQNLDGEYLDYLTAEFNEITARQGSMAALKNSFKTIVMGDAFNTPNPNRDTCYDRKPGMTAESSLPCRVASILTKNCVTCHASVETAGHLDLAHWQSFPEGKGFPHSRRSGEHIAVNTTFQSMLSRLSSTDPDVRMPYLSDMPSQDRQQLYTWLDDQLKSNRSNASSK